MPEGWVTEAILACVRLGNNPPSDPKSVAAMIAVRNSVATIFHALARLIASNPDYSRWVADNDNPGYLHSALDGVDLRAPWTLVIDFPDDVALRDFIRHALAVKYDGTSVICLSGSMLSRSAVGAASDLDLCEYVSDGTAFSDVVRHAYGHDGPEAVCVWIGAHVADRVGAEPTSVSITRPWSPEKAAAYTARVADAPVGKCDFAVVSTVEGAIEVTKLVLHVDPRYTDTEGVWDLSFPFQEVPLNGGSWVPRRLSSPGAIGRYVVWLFRQVEAQAVSAPAKAAKRALSLARILHVRPLAEAAQDVLRRDDLALRTAIRARRQFHQRLAAMDDPVVQAVCAKLTATIGALEDRLPDSAVDSTPPGEERERRQEAQMGDIVEEFRRILEPSVRSGRY